MERSEYHTVYRYEYSTRGVQVDRREEGVGVQLHLGKSVNQESNDMVPTIG